MANEITTAAKVQPTIPEARPQTDNGAMAMMIERVVMDPSLPIERLTQMIELKERMEDRALADQQRRAEQSYFTDMAKCQAALPVVRKSRSNAHTKSSYADLADIERDAMPIIHAHGFSVSFQPDGISEGGDLRIIWHIGHSGGFSRSGLAEIPMDGKGLRGSDNKTAVQSFGSTASYGRRYLLCMLFNISTGDDTDGNAPPVKEGPAKITADQFIALRDKLEESGMKPLDFHTAMGAKRPDLATLEEFPAGMFDQAMARLNKYIAKRAEKEAEK